MRSESVGVDDPAFNALVEDKALRVQEEPITTWKQLNDFTQDSPLASGWVFRGHSDWNWELESTLRRAATDLQVPDIQRRELGMIRRFKREYRQYVQSVPPEDDYIQWMSIMRHHGAPARLLDVTYSIYVAIYFALAEAKCNRAAALWCLNIGWLTEAYGNMAPIGYKEKLDADKRGVFSELYRLVLNDRALKVYLLNPYEMPTRLTRQNGGLLVPIDITASFYKNPLALRLHSATKPWIIKQKLMFGPDELKEVLLNLRKMNITAGTLFPGIDGFASSLRMLMTIPHETHSYTDQFV